MTHKACSSCGVSFSCGVGDRDGPCWCEAMPLIMPVDAQHDCECPECLARNISTHLTELIHNTPVAEMVGIAAGYRTANLVKHIDYELEDGNYVFTRWFHLKRGSCCGNRCRHCPYDHEACPP